jgi:hypothetical protein
MFLDAREAYFLKDANLANEGSICLHLLQHHQEVMPWLRHWLSNQ